MSFLFCPGPIANRKGDFKMSNTKTNATTGIVDKKIQQKLMLIAKQGQYEQGVLNGESIYIGESKDGDGPSVILLREKKGDPRSPYSMEYLSNSGLTDRMAPEMRRLHGMFKVEHTGTGRKLQLVEKDVIVCEDEYHVSLGGMPVEEAYVINEDLYQVILAHHEQQLAKQKVSPTPGFDERVTVPVALAQHLVFGVSSPAETRAGSFDFLIDRGPNTLYHFLRKSGYEISTFLTSKNNGLTGIDINKAAKRPKLAASSSRDFKLVPDGYLFSHREVVMYDFFNGKEETQVPVVNYVLKKENDVDICIGVASEDFTVYTEEELFVPVFAGKRFVRFKKVTKTIKRAATDGAIYSDHLFAERVGLDKLGSGSQIRAFFNGKGMKVIAPGLKSKTGFDMLFFAGAVKGDIGKYIEENRFYFAVLNLARQTKPELENVIKVSRQVLATVGNKEMMAKLLDTNKRIMKELYSFSEERLSAFVGYQELSDEEDVDDDAGADMQNATVDILNANLSVALQSAEVRKRLTDLLDSTTRKLQSGAYFMVEEASIKHMMVDPYAILMYLGQGKLSAVREGDGDFGIRRKHAVISAYFGESLVPEARKAFLARFPFLHKMEGQLVNADGQDWYLDAGTKNYYEWAMKLGYFQGFVLYSLWDMIPEGQSGADYDGDTSLYITCSAVVDHISETTLFLDYSLVVAEDGTEELIAGCPFSESMDYMLEDLLSQGQMALAEEYGLRLAKKDDGFKGISVVFPTEHKENEDVLGLVVDAMAHLSMKTLDSNNIGRYTNIKASIDSLIDALRVNELEPLLESFEVLRMLLSLPEDGLNREALLQAAAILLDEIKAMEKEIAGYELLTVLLAVAIRWEIDKAKHGGAFKEIFSFLGLFEGVEISKENRLYIKQQEEQFGISLERFLTGTRTK